MRYHEIINEAVENVTVLGATFPVYKNPSPHELLNLSLRKKFRGLVDNRTGDTYWWNAKYAIHISVARQLGLSVEIVSPTSISNFELEHRVLTPFIKIHNGVKTAITSRFLKNICEKGKILIKSGNDMLSFDEYCEEYEKFSPINSD